MRLICKCNDSETRGHEMWGGDNECDWWLAASPAKAGGLDRLALGRLRPYPKAQSPWPPPHSAPPQQRNPIHEELFEARLCDTGDYRRRPCFRAGSHSPADMAGPVMSAINKWLWVDDWHHPAVRNLRRGLRAEKCFQCRAAAGCFSGSGQPTDCRTGTQGRN